MRIYLNVCKRYVYANMSELILAIILETSYNNIIINYSDITQTEYNCIKDLISFSDTCCL